VLWELRLSEPRPTWNPIDLADPPPSRFGHAAMYDPGRDRMLLFGGSHDQAEELNDLYELSLAGAPSWHELPAAGEPPPKRTTALAARDAGRDRMIVFGGQNRDGGLDDTWALSLAHGPVWVNLTPYAGAAPTARSAAGGAFDPLRNELLLFGGYNTTAEGGLGDLWRLTLAQGHPLDVAVDAAGAGTVRRSPNQGCYSPGEAVTLTPVAAPGYRFTGWTGDAEGEASPLTVVMDGYKSIVGRFELVSTATLLAQFVATRSDRGVELRWRFGTPERVVAVAIERAPSASGPWAPPSLETRQESGATLALDLTAEPGSEYFYRLVASLRDGPNTIFGPVSARTHELITESAITMVAPNPCTRDAQIQFAVARPGRVRIVIADVAGRAVATLVDGTYKPGPYTAAWDGTAARGPVAPGLYFVRLTTPDRASVRRLVIVR